MLQTHEFVSEYPRVMFKERSQGPLASPRKIRPLLRTTYSAEPENDVVGKTYELLRAWLPDTLTDDSERRASWNGMLYSSSHKYNSARKDYQSITFTADEEATWRESQEQAGRDQQEARRSYVLAKHAKIKAEIERDHARREYEELEDAAMDELKRRHRKERLLPPDDRSYPPSFLSASGPTREIVEWYKNLKYKPPPAPRPLFVNFDSSSDASDADQVPDEEW